MINYGSFGDIFKISKKQDEKIYAMKQMKYRGDFRDDAYIMSELYCLSRLKHRNIISLHDIVIDVIEIHIIMEYAANENLQRYLFSHKNMSHGQKYDIFAQVLHGVMYCHSMEIAHRDLTPVNILLTDDVMVKIADFGLAVKCISDAGSLLLCTDYIGTASYLPPQVLSQQPFLPKPVDVWSLGILLIFIICLEVPYKGFQDDILAQQRKESWVDFIEIKSHALDCIVPKEILCLLRECLRLDATERTRIEEIVCKWDKFKATAL
ncbi:testis-specific serine/threonine-protein kinase 1-like [Dreissena polymorpha]|nr:testis-specific serine/threonine-protein kinase 1-like [Dreissena polymorpha]